MNQLSMFPDESPKLEPVDDKDLVILLDLNYTLVANSSLKQQQKNMPYAQKILSETYRDWLVELVRGHTVLLCTVRWEGYEETTMKHILELTGWQPERAFFNPDKDVWQGDIVKAKYLPSIFSHYGQPSERKYFAVESATATKAMYKRNGIASASVGNQRWTRLPL